MPRQKQTDNLNDDSVMLEEPATLAQPNDDFINPLKNEKIRINLLPKKSGLFDRDDHILAGNLAPDAKIRYTAPRLSNGSIKQILTAAEQKYLENVMGLDPGALSLFKKENNFWEDYSTNVTLGKEGNVLDLSLPMDYIKYKILLANDNYICPSLDKYRQQPKESYRFVIVRDEEEMNQQEDKMSDIQTSYFEFGKVQDSISTMRVIIETIERRKTAPTSQKPALKNKINSLIQNNPKLFRSVITDPMLPAKVLIHDAVEAGEVLNLGGQYYIREGKIPMCGNNEEPTLAVASKWINHPKQQEIKFNIESKIKNK